MVTDIVRSLVGDLTSGTAPGVCAARFHNSIARGTVKVCERIRERDDLSTVALSGGVFANVLLLERTWALLRERHFEVLANSVVPPGDGGVSLGQAAVAARRLSCV
jgi:hydrogenase maturation protein HypF